VDFSHLDLRWRAKASALIEQVRKRFSRCSERMVANLDITPFLSSVRVAGDLPATREDVQE
jgi:hypothetical protein